MPAESAHFWNELDALLNASEIVIERPKGSAHPAYKGTSYPLDYGFLKDTSSSDSGEIDVWIGSGDTRTITGVICTVDFHKRDAEIKLIVDCNDDEMHQIETFHNTDMAGLLIKREK